MVLQTHTGSDRTFVESADTCYDRHKHLISALHDLKGRISRVEQQHPYLRDDLSSTCDKAILSLQGSSGLSDKPAATETCDTLPPMTRINLLSLALDKTGTCIINGLDLMGDGIIFLFGKIVKAFN